MNDLGNQMMDFDTERFMQQSLKQQNQKSTRKKILVSKIHDKLTTPIYYFN